MLRGTGVGQPRVSVLFNEPKLLKSSKRNYVSPPRASFSALQRAEIAEIAPHQRAPLRARSFSALQRAEIAEIGDRRAEGALQSRFSALQRAEIAEIETARGQRIRRGEFQCSSTSRNC